MEIICIGNELLIGKTSNTNATWLAKSVTSLGLPVTRIAVVEDDVDEIAGTIREALARKPKLIITTGGLGPTFDDKTLEGIAKALGRRLEVNANALRMVRTKYEAYLKQRKSEKIELTRPRVKMATLPRGAWPLPNPIGTAPGVMVKAEGTMIVALPGVPPEMEAIFVDSLTKIIKNEAGRRAFFEMSIYAEGIMESTLAPLTEQAMHDNPCVYIKSHVYTKSTAQTEGKSCIELHFSTTADDAKIAKNHLQEAIVQLTKLVQESGGKIVT